MRNKRIRDEVVVALFLAFAFLVFPASAGFDASSNQSTLNWRVYATTPTNLANTSSGNWVNWTWDTGSGRIPPSSWNVSINSTWHNGTTTTFYNQSGAHWINITVWGWNSTDGVLSEASVSGQEKIANHAPSTPSLVSPTNLSEINDATPFFNWTCSDADDDRLTYTLQIDNESGFSSPYVYENTTITDSNLTLAVADALTDYVNYTWRVRAHDTYEYGTWATAYNFTLDTVLPTITAMNRTPDSVLVGNSVTITCTVTDDVSGVENVSVQIKNAKDIITNYTLTAGADNSFSYTYTYTGKEGWYYIQYFNSYDEAGNFRENASTLSFSATSSSAGGPGGGPGVVPSPTPDVNATVTPPPPLEWIRRPEMPVSGRDAITVVGGVVGAAFAMLMLAIMWNYNKKQKREGKR